MSENRVIVDMCENGDIVDVKSAKSCLELTNAAGLMIVVERLDGQISSLKLRLVWVGKKRKVYVRDYCEMDTITQVEKL